MGLPSETKIEPDRRLFLCVLQELIFAIGTDLFFLLGIDFYDFQKVTFKWIGNIFVFIEYFNRNIDFKTIWPSN